MKSFLVGLVAGCFGGLVGLGGGVIMIPLMTGLLGMDQHKAHGTSITVVVCSGIAGAITYGARGDVDLMAAFLLALSAVLTSRAGARFAQSLPEWKLKRAFGAFLLFVTAILLVKPLLPVVHGLDSGWREILTLSLAGALTGFLSGMMGVGGGPIMVPVLAMLAGFSQHAAQGTSLLAIVPIGIAGAFAHWRLGNVKADALPGLIPGALIGTTVAGLAAGYVREDILRVLFSAVLLWTVARYLLAKKPGDVARAP